jgi:hypothetical protein
VAPDAPLIPVAPDAPLIPVAPDDEPVAYAPVDAIPNSLIVLPVDPV